jgi:hypothetical protein
MAGAPDKTRCAVCQVRDHALGGRNGNGVFLLALPTFTDNRIAWPRIGSSGWCGATDGEVQRLTIVRISLSRTTLNGALRSSSEAVAHQEIAYLCQHCLRRHDSRHADLFAEIAA